MGAISENTAAVVYAPRVLRSMTEICEAFGVGSKTVKAWVGKGAPIAVEGDEKNTRYSAEMARLQAWRIWQNREYFEF